MPLHPGSSKGIISSNIREMMTAGHPQKQAVAASLSNARRHPHRALGGEVAAFHEMSPREKTTSGLHPYLPGGERIATGLRAPSIGSSRDHRGRFLPRFQGGGATSSDPSWIWDEGELLNPATAPRAFAMKEQLRESQDKDHQADFQGGGGILGLPPDIAPSPQSTNPIQLSQIQRYEAMPVEKLQELSVVLGPSPQGNVIRRVLQSKQMQPGQGIAPPTMMAEGGSLDPATYLSAMQNMLQISRERNPYTGRINVADAKNVTLDLRQELADKGFRGFRDGGIAHMQMGGIPMSMADPPWERHQQTATATGFLLGSTPGRADQVNVSPPAGSYVWPADVIAGLGEGNSLAGAAILQKALHTGPHGTPLPSGMRGYGVGIPRPPPRFTEPLLGPAAQHGGRLNGRNIHSEEPTPIMAAHGEYISPPAEVRLWGRGDLKRGHDVFDQAVVGLRKEQIEKLKKLKGPVKA